MKKIISSLVFAFICLNAYSQINDRSSDGVKIFTKVQQPAQFPGGEEMFKKYFERNFNLKAAAPYLKEETQIAKVQFLVDSLGLVSNVSMVDSKSIDPALAELAMKLIKRGPKWQPAVQNRRNVTYLVILPIVIPALKDASIAPRK